MVYHVYWVNPTSGQFTFGDTINSTGEIVAVDYDNTLLRGGLNTVWYGLMVIPPAPSQRAHFQRAVMDENGDVVPGCSVRFIDPVSGFLDLDPTIIVWDSDNPGTGTLSNPYVCSTGVVDFYLTYPQRIALGITPPGGVEHIIPGIDVLTPDTTSGGGGGPST